MSQMSNYLENIMTDHIFRARTFAKPSVLGIALYTTAPTDAGGGVEVAGNGYARATVTPSDAAWLGTHGTTTGNSSGTAGASSNASIIPFPTPTADWGLVTSWAIFDAASGGNMLMWGSMNASKTINVGDGVTFQSGQIVVTAA